MDTCLRKQTFAANLPLELVMANAIVREVGKFHSEEFRSGKVRVQIESFDVNCHKCGTWC